MRFRPSYIRAVLAAHVVLVAYLAVVSSPVDNERRHLLAGLAIWRAGRFDVFAQNAPLPHALAALLPAWFSDVPLGASERDLPLEALLDAYDSLPELFGPAWHRELVVARLSMLPCVLAAAWGLFVLAQRLAGPWAGVAAATLWCFNPVVLTWAATVKHDVAGAAGAVWAVIATCDYVARPGAWRAARCGLFWAVAVLCRLSWLPLALGLPLLWLCISICHLPWREVLRRAGDAVLFLVVLCLLCNAGYGFTGSLRPLGSIAFRSTTLTGLATVRFGQTGNRFAGTWIGVLPVPLPELLVTGLDLQMAIFQHRRFPDPHDPLIHGRWWWATYVAAYKTPIGTIAAVAGGVVACLWIRPWSKESLQLVAVVMVVAAYSWGALLFAGRYYPLFRYAIPALMWPFVLAGVVCGKSAGRLVCGVGALGVLETIVASVYWYPFTDSYVNWLLPGPQWLVGHVDAQDIDSAQHNWRVRQWVAAHPSARPVCALLNGPPAPPPQRLPVCPVRAERHWVIVSIASRGALTSLTPEPVLEGHLRFAAITPVHYVFAPAEQDEEQLTAFADPGSRRRLVNRVPQPYATGAGNRGRRGSEAAQAQVLPVSTRAKRCRCLPGARLRDSRVRDSKLPEPAAHRASRLEWRSRTQRTSGTRSIPHPLRVFPLATGDGEQRVLLHPEGPGATPAKRWPVVASGVGERR